MAGQKLEKVTLATAVNHNGTVYKPGDTFEGDKRIVAELRQAGAVRDESADAETPVEDTTIADAESERKKL